jgi:hypothetical protein
MADEDRLKIISDNLEATYQSLRQAAANISGLLQVGRATCDEVRAYNLWALAIYNTQRGMLTALRSGGEPNVPELPPNPTLFAWNGVEGADALNVDCSGQEQSLSGLMKRAMAPARAMRGFRGRGLRGPSVQYLSSRDIRVVTSDPFAFNPSAAPSFASLVDIQNKRQQQAVHGLGAIGILIAIAGIIIAVSVAIVAIMHYLETSAVEESNTAQVRDQAQAYANYTSAKLQCYQTCTGEGKSTEECVARCDALVAKPDIKLPGQDAKWGLLQWTGFTVLLGAGAIAAWRLYQRHHSGRPLFELPESVDHALHPGSH